jgi:hypothetical protein
MLPSLVRKLNHLSGCQDVGHVSRLWTIGSEQFRVLSGTCDWRWKCIVHLRSVTNGYEARVAGYFHTHDGHERIMPAAMPGKS